MKTKIKATNRGQAGCKDALGALVTGRLSLRPSVQSAAKRCRSPHGAPAVLCSCCCSVPLPSRSKVPHFLCTLFPVCLPGSPSPPGCSFHKHLHVFCETLDVPSSVWDTARRHTARSQRLSSCPGESNQGHGCSWLNYTCPRTKVKRSDEKLSVVLSNTLTYL